MGYYQICKKCYYYAVVVTVTGTFRTLQIFPLNRNVRFLPCQHPGRWHNTIRVRAKPCVHRFNYSRTLAEEVPRRRLAWT